MAVYQDDIGDAYVISYGRNGRDLLAADLYGTVKIWDSPDNTEDHVLDPEGRVSSLVVSPDARWIAGVVKPEATTPWGNTPVVKLWDAKGRFVRSFGRSVLARDDEIAMGWLTWSPRGDRIAFVSVRYIRSVGAPKGTINSGGSALTIWDLDGKEIFHIEEEGVFFFMPSFGVDGARVAAIRSTTMDLGTKEARVWDISTGRLVTTVPNCTSAVLDPRGRRLAGFSRSADRSWRAAVWDAEMGAERIRLEMPDRIADPGLILDMMGMAYGPEGQRVAASIAVRVPYMGEISRSVLVVWDVASGKLQHVVQGEFGTLAFSPDGSRIASAYGSIATEVGLWDTATGRQVLALKGIGSNSSSRYSGIAFTPNGHQIVSAVPRGRLAGGVRKEIEIKLWDATPWTGTPDGDPRSRR